MIQIPNQHIKLINGHRYFYESIRIGRHVTSRYLGPVDGYIRRSKRKKVEETEPAPSEVNQAKGDMNV